MSYSYNSSGKLSFVNSYVPPTMNLPSSISSNINQNVADPIRPMSLYVHSDTELAHGHVAAWTSQKGMHNSIGASVTNFSADNGHEYAIQEVEHNSNENDKVAGIIIDTAAQPGQTQYTNKNGIHVTQNVANNTQFIHRMATSGSIVLAWICLDDHENSLNGMYDEYENGILKGKAIVRKIDNEYFSISSIASSDSFSSRVTELEARLDALTT